jgi:Abnormal spindle-like microcephaly-assoc'd, ASPM-SPD-2-Hydin
MRRFLVALCLAGLIAGVVGSAASTAPPLPADITAKPSKVSFGGVKLLDQKTVTVTLTNNTSKPLYFQGSSRPPGFGYNAFGCGDITAGASCTFDMTFGPQTSGKVSGTYTFNYATGYPDPVVPYSVGIAVSGTGR